jgi:integrase
MLVACGCLLGLRVEEIVMLRWQDFELDAKDPKTGEARPLCHITPHGDWQPKDGESRDIPVSAVLLPILLAHRKAEGYLLQAETVTRLVRKAVATWAYRYDPRKV